MKKGVINFLLTSLVFFTVDLEFTVAWSNSVKIISWANWLLFDEGQGLIETFNEF